MLIKLSHQLNLNEQFFDLANTSPVLIGGKKMSREDVERKYLESGVGRSEY